MQRATFETLMGFLVLFVAIIFVFTSYKTAGVNKGSSYTINAQFQDITGIAVGSDVAIAGVKIGTVAAQELDKDTYLATIKLNVNKDIKLPKDSSAKIVSSGLLGGKFIEIQVGADEEFIENNGMIKYTQSSVNLESLISKFMFGSVKNEKQDSETK